MRLMRRAAAVLVALGGVALASLIADGRARAVEQRGAAAHEARPSAIELATPHGDGSRMRVAGIDARLFEGHSAASPEALVRGLGSGCATDDAATLAARASGELALGEPLERATLGAVFTADADVAALTCLRPGRAHEAVLVVSARASGEGAHWTLVASEGALAESAPRAEPEALPESLAALDASLGVMLASGADDGRRVIVARSPLPAEELAARVRARIGARDGERMMHGREHGARVWASVSSESGSGSVLTWIEWRPFAGGEHG